ncbi:MAG: hypothetical protein AAGC81_03105 [Pseudomonadota bacterium]
MRAIEQSTLSRLSLSLNGAEFEFAKVAPRQYELLVEQQGLRFDTRQVFPDRLVSRVISARQVRDPAGSRLRFILNCDCDATTQLSKGALLIEFFDPNAEEEGPKTASNEPVSQSADLRAQLNAGALEVATSSEPTNDVESVSTPADDLVTAPTRSPLPVAKPKSQTASEPAIVERNEPEPTPEVVLIEPSQEGASDVSPESTDPDQDDELRLARDKLLEQLTRAAEQGLLEFAIPEGEPNDLIDLEAAPLEGPESFVGVGPSQQNPMVEIGSDETERSSTPRPPLELPIRAKTAIDRDFVAGRKDTVSPVETCNTGQMLSGIDWLDPKDPARALSALRGEILGEFDQPRPDIIERLVVLYISLGFGIEAQKLLELYGDSIEHRRIYEDLAAIVDGEPIVWGEGIARNGPCSGTVALWLAAAGLRDLDEFKTEDTDPALIDAFAILPLKMRKLLGPRILTNAVDEENTALARRIDQLLQRSGGELGTAQNLALARLISVEGRPEAAEAIYTRIAASRGELATEALLRLVESKLKRGAPISQIEREELAFSAFVYRADPEGRDLRLTDLQVRAGGPGLPEVLSEIKRHLADAPTEAAEYRDIGHLLLEESAREDVGDAAYAQAVLSYVEEISTSAAGDAARARIARELTAAGLANLALDVLNVALPRRAREVRLAAGEALISLDRPQDALPWLEGVDGLDSRDLKIRAYQAQETPEDALSLVEQDDQTEDDSRLAELSWQAGAWDDAAETGPEARRLLAAFMAGRELAEPDVDADRGQAFLSPPELTAAPSLRSSKEVLDGSTKVREIIEEALGDG